MSTLSIVERAALIISQHEPVAGDDSLCICGVWIGTPGVHVALKLAQAGLLADDAFPPDTPEWAAWQHALAQLRAALATSARKLSGGP